MSVKFYWLKLKDDFFDDLTIKMIEEMDNGVYYTNFLLKLYLKSLKNEGKLLFRDTMPYDEKMLSVLTGVDIDVVHRSLEIFLEFGMVERWEDGTLYISEVQKMIGEESDSAERVRKHRAHQKSLGITEKKRKKPVEQDVVDVEFDIFWKMYCKPVDRKKCLVRWGNLKKSDIPKILEHVPKYVGSTPNKKFRKNPLTYLNGDSWNDEIQEAQTAGNRRAVKEYAEDIKSTTIEV